MLHSCSQEWYVGRKNSLPCHGFNDYSEGKGAIAQVVSDHRVKVRGPGYSMCESVSPNNISGLTL